MFLPFQFAIIFLMKKIIIVISIICASFAIGLVMLLTPSPTQKHPTSDILTTFSHETFYSNYKTLPEKSLNTYTLQIHTLSGTKFETPSITTSTNITKTIEFDESSIKITFQILFGAEFSFTFTTSNYESLVITNHATEYVQPDNISLGISTSPLGQEVGYMDESTNVLYLVDEEHKLFALQDGKPSTLYIKAYAPAACGCVTFDSEISETAHFNAEQQTEFLQISAKSLGTSYITFTANDGSGASKKFLFRVEFVKATTVSGLPTEISINVSENIYFAIPEIKPVPIYAKGYEIAFESSDESIFTITNTKITALKIGSANLVVKIDGEIAQTIPVVITGTFIPKFSFALNQSTISALGENISFDTATNTIILNYGGLENTYSTIIINVAFLYYNGNLFPINANISDPNTLILGTPVFIVGNENFAPYKLNIMHQTSEIEIDFSKTIYGHSINSKIKIKLINN